MERKPDQIDSDERLKDLPATSATGEGFQPEQMIVCPKCARVSPPNRLKCLYCAALLPVAETGLIKPNLRRLESWEKGFNIIYQPSDLNFDEAKISEIADLLKFEPEDLRRILTARKRLPIARAESAAEAAVVAERLKQSGVESFVLSDDLLKPESPARRLRGIEFFDDKVVLILFNNDEIAEIRRADLCLIVTGARVERKIEIVEKYNRKKENKILDSRESGTDDSLIDVYGREDFIGCRIESTGFDFSCLGGEKRMLAGENIKLLAEKLRAFSPDAHFDDDYRRLRAELGGVWTVEQKKDSKGVRKQSFGSFNLESVTIIDNLTQFTKYSRLQRHLL